MDNIVNNTWAFESKARKIITGTAIEFTQSYFLDSFNSDSDTQENHTVLGLVLHGLGVRPGPDLSVD